MTIWSDAPARVDLVIQQLGLSRSRNAAQQAIAAGQVSIDGNLVTKAGLKVQTGQKVKLSGGDHYVSRGAHKLIGALDSFSIAVHNRVALDVGASTGGFTQVLLERGAATVLAIDVGHDQLVEPLRSDPRVRLYEGCNARYLTATQLHEHTGEARQPDLIVGDLSFISLTQVLPALTEVMAPDADIALLIKPQFEVGRASVGDGVVTDPDLQLTAIRGVIECGVAQGLRAVGLRESPILGGQGNREFLVHFVRGSNGDEAAITEMMGQAVFGEGGTHG